VRIIRFTINVSVYFYEFLLPDITINTYKINIFIKLFELILLGLEKYNVQQLIQIIIIMHLELFCVEQNKTKVNYF